MPLLPHGALETSMLCFVSMNLPSLGTSSKGNHTGFILSHLAYFTEHTVLYVHPCCSLYQNFLPFGSSVVWRPKPFHTSSACGHLGLVNEDSGVHIQSA